MASRKKSKVRHKPVEPKRLTAEGYRRLMKQLHDKRLPPFHPSDER